MSCPFKVTEVRHPKNNMVFVCALTRDYMRCVGESKCPIMKK